MKNSITFLGNGTAIRVTDPEDGIAGSLLGTAAAVASDPTHYTPVGGHNSATIGATVITLSPPAGSNWVILQALTQNIRLTLDGTTPSATVGFQIRAGDPAVRIPITSTTVIKYIEETSGAVVQRQFIS